MSSRNKNFRRRSDSTDPADEKPASPAPSSGLARPKKPETGGGRARLSFAEDEDDEDGINVVAPRSSAAPRKLSSASPAAAVADVQKIRYSKDRTAGGSSKLSNVRPQAGEYTKERLLELQKNARPLGALKSKPSNSAEPVIVLKGLVKPLDPTTSSNDPDHKQLSELDSEDDDGEEERNGNVEKLRFGKLGINPKTLKDSSVIPDKATIDAIRARRERLRQSRGPAPDYISLDDGGVLASRSSRDGGSSDEDDADFRGRMSLFGDKDGDGSKKGVFEDLEEKSIMMDMKVAVHEDDEDDEDRKWEEEQVRKGLGKRIEESSGVLPSVSNVPVVQPKPSLYSVSVNVGPVVGDLRSTNLITFTEQAEIAKRAFYENIARLQETHSRTMNSLTKTDEQLSEAISNVTDLEQSLSAAGEKFVFVQQLRDYISVICDFLQDKASLIEELEEQMQKLHEERASAVVERRAADIADMSNEVEAAVSAAILVLNKGSSPAYISAAVAAAQAASAAARESANLPVQLDEFGRDINLQRRMDVARRDEARKQRKAKSDSKRMSRDGKNQQFQTIEGESSTDESDSESSAYQSSRDELLQTAAEVFSDAADEYSKLSVVKEKFESWKRLDPLSYRDAYISLSVPAIFSPYVRLELLKWDPLHHKADFNDMEWHDLLFDYGLPGKDRDFDPNDADANLIPELVEKVALPILHHDIAHCWDILSTKRTENAVFATSLVINYIKPSSAALKEFLAVVRTRLDEAVAKLNLPTWNPVITNAVPGAAQHVAHRFGMSLRLLKNICLWKDILALPILEKLALEELLVKKLLPHIRTVIPNIYDAIMRTERIIASLSGVWFGASVTGDHRQKLQPLVDLVVKLGQKLEERRGHASEDETMGFARRLKKMLVMLNEYEKARDILRRFQLKEAL